jgi:hypothetical protein
MKFEEQLEMSYMAGVMDGDGSFSLIKRINPNGRSPLYYPYLQLGSLSKELTEYFKQKLGGFTGVIKGKLCKDGIVRRTFYTWKSEKNGPAFEALNKICDFLVLKKERARFLLDYIVCNPFKRGSNPLPDDVLIRRENSYRKMKIMNGFVNKKVEFSHITASAPTKNRLFWAYLAGLLDTHGSFLIRKMKITEKTKTPVYSPIVLLSMTDISELNLIKENCPYGNFQTQKARTCATGYCSRWAISSLDDTINLIERVLPYLRVKKENAKMLLNFCLNRVPVKHRRASVPQKELEFRENCYQELIHMNKYGVYKLSLIDSEALRGDEAEGVIHGERLSEKATETVDAIV